MRVGQQVQGAYGGQRFAGVIDGMRALTVKTDGCFEYVVKLNGEIEAFGCKRDSLVLFAKFDGQPSSYTGFYDSLQPI